MSLRNKIIIDTHRGKENTDFGKHSRIPYTIPEISEKALIVLAFIDIDQFLDNKYKTKKIRRVLKITDFINALNISKTTVKKCIKELLDKGLISKTFKRNFGTSYISNIIKLNVKYQIVTYSFIVRKDMPHNIKAFIIKVIMLGEDRIKNIRNVTALVKEVGLTRRRVNETLDFLDVLGYIKENKDEEGIQVLDIYGVMLDSEEKLMLEHRKLKSLVVYYESNFHVFKESDSEDIKKLKLQLDIIIEKIKRIQNGQF